MPGKKNRENESKPSPRVLLTTAILHRIESNIMTTIPIFYQK